MTLKKYKEKRSFKKTPEPIGAPLKKKIPSPLIFVVQKHAASHLHYDFRLEVNGVLKSWAIPKGPSLNPADKRLAIMVEDHPYDYRDFEGIIPEGNYGAGTVMVWDTGNYYPLDELYDIGDDTTIEEGISKGKLYFALDGKKLKGVFSLVQLKNSEKKDNWLLIKSKDKFATTKDVLKQQKSTISEKTLEEIAQKNPSICASNKNKVIKKSKLNMDPSKDEMPTDIKPMLSFLIKEPFDNPDWLFETKWDGFRAIAEVHENNVKLYSRSLQSFNDRFPKIVEALQKLKFVAIFDGEVVILDKDGKSSFQDLQNFQKTGEGCLRYYIFDLLFYKSQDLRDLPLIQRKQILQNLLVRKKNSILQLSKFVIGDGKKLFLSAQKNNLEGIMAKEMESTYVPKRDKSWLKIKIHARQEFIIGGFTEPRGSRQKFGSLLLGIYEDHELHYVGHVGTGFTEEILNDTMKKLEPLIIEKSPFIEVPKINSSPTWVKPDLICEVSFTEWTSDKHLRHPVFMGIRDEKKAKEVSEEKPLKRALNLTSKAEKNKEGTSYTHLDKIYWPVEGYTKGDLLAYYDKIAPYILPYLKDRPQSMHRFPHGIEGESFFQKNVSESFPKWLSTFMVSHHDGERKYLLIQDKKSLLFAVNLGCIEVNPFNSRIQHLEYPDYLIIDLDPEDVPFDGVVETAQVVHEILSQYDIPHYCKTSGATGLHIYIPLGAKYTHEQTKQFAELIALMVHDKLPSLTSLERSPKNRQKKVYLDYLQNNFGQTVASVYCVRPKPGAPVSTPLEWSELKPGLDPASFNMDNTLERLQKKGDLFFPILGKGIDIKKCLKQIRN